MPVLESYGSLRAPPHRRQLRCRNIRPCVSLLHLLFLSISGKNITPFPARKSGNGVGLTRSPSITPCRGSSNFYAVQFTRCTVFPRGLCKDLAFTFTVYYLFRQMSIGQREFFWIFREEAKTSPRIPASLFCFHCTLFRPVPAF